MSNPKEDCDYISKKKMAQNIKDIRSLHHDYARFLVGTLQTWTMIMETYPEAIPNVIEHMKDMAASIQEITGVTLQDES